MAQKICRHCGNYIYEKAKKCKYCKSELDIGNTPDMFCTRCKAPVHVDDNFCQYCGAIFNIPEDFEKPVIHNIMGIPYHIIILLMTIAISTAITIFTSAGKETAFDFIFFIVAFIAVEFILYIYFLPSIIAIENNHRNTLIIYITNLLFGITIIGWFVTLVMAIQSDNA